MKKRIRYSWDMQGKSGFAIVLIATFALTTSCAPKRLTWSVDLAASPGAVTAALVSDPNYPYYWDSDRKNSPMLLSPENVRPCCVFGMDIKTQLSGIPIPGFSQANIVDFESIGPHTYDAGFAGHGTDREVKSQERNAPN